MQPERSAQRRSIDRIVDISSVLLLSLTAVLSALSVYQSELWGGHQTRMFNESVAYRADAAVNASRSNALEMIDAGLSLRYVEALTTDDKATQRFLYESFRPETRPVVLAWLKLDPLHNPRAPRAPYFMPAYHLATEGAARSDDRLAASTFAEALAANRNADSFLLLTVIFSTVAFLGGMSTKFRFPFHLAIVAVGFIALIYGVARMARLPFF